MSADEGVFSLHREMVAQLRKDSGRERRLAVDPPKQSDTVRTTLRS
jgi:hypothetical protein